MNISEKSGFEEVSQEYLLNKLPSTIYKYRSSCDPIHETIIFKGELYFADPCSFKGMDPNDCKLRIYFDKDNCIKEYIDELLSMKSPMRESVANYLYEENFCSPEKIEERLKYFYEHFNKGFGIFSATLSKGNHYFWKLFGEYTGFCVGFDIRAVFDPRNTWAETITYENILPEFEYPFYNLKSAFSNPLGKDSEKIHRFILNFILTKDIKFAQEEEFRVVKNFLCYENNLEEVDRKIILPKSSIKEIIFGDKMCKNKIEKIINWCNTNKLNITLFSATDNGGTVKLEKLS